MDEIGWPRADGSQLALQRFQVFQCRVDFAFELVLSMGRREFGGAPPSYHLRLQGPFTCRIGGEHFSLDPEGSSAPTSLGPALAFFMQTVQSVTVFNGGTIRVQFEGGDTLEAGADARGQFEAWTLTGKTTTIVCCPDGDVWRAGDSIW